MFLMGTVLQAFFGVLLVLMALFLILLVLVQRGRGGGLTGALGGMGGQSAFGTRAGDTFTRITIVAAAIWIITCAVAVKYLGSSRDRFTEAGAPSRTGNVPARVTTPAAEQAAAEAAAERAATQGSDTQPSGTNAAPPAGEVDSSAAPPAGDAATTTTDAATEPATTDSSSP
jgi:preprotein translocase subunit SecG